MHGAVSQGRLDMVKAMLEERQEVSSRVLDAKDVREMTPLHTAALFDQDLIAEYLLDQVSCSFSYGAISSIYRCLLLIDLNENLLFI